jgi:hypothetical protein
MIYKFKSKAAGDVIMLGPNGDRVLRIVGREPAAKGIFEVADMPAVISAIEQAVAADEARRAATGDAAAADSNGQDNEPPAERVALRQRVWPLVEMLRRCHAAGEVVVWGV